MPSVEHMSISKLNAPGIGAHKCALMLAVAVCVIAWPVLAQDEIEPEADRILLAMTENLKSMSTISVDFDADQEIITLEGQKIQYSASGSITADRAKGFRMTRLGPFAQVEVTFDGGAVSLHDKITNLYTQLQSPGPGIDDATLEIRAATGFDAPGSDLLASDPYEILTEGVTAGTVVGSAFVNGVECDHLAFRTDLVDWQMWISKGSKPLPLKYIITTKWTAGAPQYSLRLTNWRADDIDVAQFRFTPPKDATKLELEHVRTDVTGEFSLERGQ